jgi:hypothetical protein
VRLRLGSLCLLTVATGCVTWAAVREATRKPTNPAEPVAEESPGRSPTHPHELQHVIRPGGAAAEESRGKVVTGIVLDSRSGKPLAEMDVALQLRDDDVASATTDEQGRFALELDPEPEPEPEPDDPDEPDDLPKPPVISLVVAGRHEDYATRTIALGLKEELPERSERVVRVDRRGELTGRLVDEQGQPVVHETVAVLGDDNSEETTGTDEDGAFTMVRDPGRYLVVARGSDDSPHLALETVQVGVGETVPVHLVLRPHRLYKLSARLVDESGNPAPAEVRLRRDGLSLLDRFVAGDGEWGVGEDGTLDAEVATPGRYTIELRPLGCYGHDEKTVIGTAVLQAGDGQVPETIVVKGREPATEQPPE